MSKNSSQPGITSGPVAKAVGLHLEGKRQEALDELKRAVESGDDESPEVYSAKGHLEYELEDRKSTRLNSSHRH